MPTNTAIPLETVARYPLPGMAIPGSLTFSPDDALLAYLASPDGSLTRQLYAYDPAQDRSYLLVDAREGDTDASVSLAEALRRERQRQRETGITRYAWGKENRLLIPLRGGLYVVDAPGQPLRELVPPGDDPLLDAQFSPDGRFVSFVQDAEIYVVPVEGGAPQQVTRGARGAGKTHGLAEYIAQEELARRHGYWWSPDGERLAFAEVDETHIPIYRIMHLGKDAVGHEAQEDHRYPFAGQANARVRLGVVSRQGGEPTWIDLGEDDDFYLARVNWAANESWANGRLLVQRLNRAQTRLDLLLCDPESGQSRPLLTETSAVWINLHHLLRPVKQIDGVDGGGFIWGSERSGFMHLYLYDWQGNEIRPLTRGDWLVESIAGVDAKRQIVYFTATKESPLELHLYAVSLAGGDVRRLTKEPGRHSAVLNHAKTQAASIHHAPDKPPVVRLLDLHEGAVQRTIFDQPPPLVGERPLPPPNIVTLANRHGDTLYGAIYRPEGEGPFPAIVSVYGGPHAQRVTQSWLLTVDMRAQYLAGLGFLVFKLDNRGSANRGLAFEAPIRHNMGDVEVQDQVDGVRWLVEQGLADPQRVGVYGWSYGGYMAAMCLARAPQTFKAAVAGAPVTHWDGYDTAYTERYMGAPQQNPDGYAISSVMRHVDNLEGKLLLVHGLIDENVHFRHTARLVNALIRARKPYELLIFPDERHSPRSEADRIYMEERIRDFFVENL